MPGDVTFSGTTTAYVYLNRDNQIASDAVVRFEHTSGYGYLVMMGHTQTVAGISCDTIHGVIENVVSESGVTRPPAC